LLKERLPNFFPFVKGGFVITIGPARDDLFLLNGCGPQDSGFKPPDLIFREACDRHDLAYRIGGTEDHRQAADDEFLDDMLDACEEKSWWVRWWYRWWAWTYYEMVRDYGDPSFVYREDLEITVTLDLLMQEESERQHAGERPYSPLARCLLRDVV